MPFKYLYWNFGTGNLSPTQYILPFVDWLEVRFVLIYNAEGKEYQRILVLNIIDKGVDPNL